MATYLITGGLGFIGRALTRALVREGDGVRILDACIPQVHETADYPEVAEAEIVRADVRDAEAVRAALAGVDGVFHLAAEVGVAQSMYEIDRYVGANDLGTAVLLQELIAQPVPRIVVASSMSVYGEGLYRDARGQVIASARRKPEQLAAGRWEMTGEDGGVLVPIATNEGKPVDLASIYALTKYVQERAVLLFGQAYGVEAVALRLFNVFGAGQALSNPYTGVLANFASRLANGRPPTIFEDGHQRRDFVHVEDVARAFRLAMTAPGVTQEVINVGSGHSYTIRRVAELLAAAMGVPQIEPEILRRARAGDIRHCFADISRARALLGFEPLRRLEDSLPEFAEWVAASPAVDRGPQMREQLEQRGLVA
jgi:dTDP-L-rhamnose 4-epimerase